MNLISNRDLFDLVKSLSKSEKRFLKLTASASDLNPNLITLFNTIEVATDFREDFFTKKSKDEALNIKSQISDNLYNFILKCLRSFHAESSASYIIKDEITNILNLFDKAQYKQCRKILNKQKQEAYRFERFHFILELIGLEKLLISIETQFNIKHNTIEELVKEEQTVIEKAKNLGTYTLLYSKINLNTRQKNKAKTEEDMEVINSFLNSPLLKNDKSIKSKKALIIYHHCRSILFCRCQDNQSREEECELLLKIMDDHKELIEEMPSRYLTTLNNLVNIAYEEKKYKTCALRIKQIEEKANLKAFNTTDLQLKIFTSVLNGKLTINTNSGYQKESLANVEEIEKGLTEYKSKISKEEELVFYYNIAIMNTYFGNYEKAQHYIGLILNEGNNLLREDLQSFARILNIGLHYELNNFKQLGYIISTIKNYYKTQVSYFKTEKLILSYFEKLSELKIKNKTNEKEIFLSFKKDLEDVMKDPHEKNVSFYFDIEVYIESKISNTPMDQLMKKKYAKAWLN
ncbi:MAG: hypothetical protein K0S53_1167 [Bacteroidetes bacterium]|jgi:hypothetical protein|nr:hypothetical protein [Bacteroidota bacterium]